MNTAAATQTKLPTPEERPTADVLIYDGHCRMCRGQVERLARWDTRHALAFLSLHDPVVAQRYPDLSYDALMQAMVLVDQQGGRHWGAAAVRYLSRRLPWLWPLSPILHIPGTLPVWQWCYRRVANLRYRLGGRIPCEDGTCQLHLK